MTNLFEILRGAQGGQAVDAFARQFGLSPEEMTKAAAALLPAFAMGLQRSAAQPNNFARFAEMLSSGRFDTFYDNAQAAFSPQAGSSGQDVLSQLFGSPDLTRQVAEQAAAYAGLNADTINRLMPAFAATLMGGMAKAAAAQGTTSAFAQFAEAMKGNMAPPRPPERPAHQAGTGMPNPWEAMMGAFFPGMAANRPQAAPPPPQRPANPWEEMMSAMFGFGRKPGETPPSATPQQPSGAEPRPAEPNAFTLYEQMIVSGRELHDQHLAGLKRMFDAYWAKDDGKNGPGGPR